MSKQTINIGASPNDGTGTPLRTSFDYTNQNFTELYTALGGGVGLPGATTQVIFNDGGTNLAGDAGLVYNKTTDALTVAGLVTAGSATITGALTVDTNTLVVDPTNDRVGIATAAPGCRVDIVSDSNTSLAPVLRVNSNNVAVNTSLAYDGLIGSSTLTIQSGTSSPIVFNTNGANESGRINTTGVYVLKGGTTTANGVGVAFPATQVASSDANCLDDYEEGTFVPTVGGSTVSGTGTYSVQTGFYTKVGNLVTVEVFLTWTNIVGATGIMILAGLPFQSTSSTNAYSAASIAYVNNISLTASNVLTGMINPGSSFVELQQYPVGGGASTTVTIDTAGSIIYTATYRV